MSTLRETAQRVGWKVRRVASREEAAEHVMGLIRALEPLSVLRSAHTVVDGLGLEAWRQFDHRITVTDFSPFSVRNLAGLVHVPSFCVPPSLFG